MGLGFISLSVTDPEEFESAGRIQFFVGLTVITPFNIQIAEFSAIFEWKGNVTFSVFNDERCKHFFEFYGFLVNVVSMFYFFS
jgi:hypothetical protein